MTMTNNTDPVRKAIRKARNIADGAGAHPSRGHLHADGMRRACNIIEAALASAPPSGGGSSESDADLLARLGDDAQKWAQEFRATAIKLGYSDMDEGWLIGWFANAIEHSSDVRRWRAEAAPPSAPVGVEGGAVDGWQHLAADWLEQQAEEQEATNAEYPKHAAAYSEWRDRPVLLRMLAEKVKKAEGSIKRHCPPPSWMFPDDPSAPVGVDEAWRQKAAAWLEAKAVEQEANNQRWPDHAAAYKEWRDRPGVLRYLAAQVLAAQQPAAPSGEAVAWRHPDEIPEVASGSHGYFWVAVRRKDGRVRSFPAQYLNAMLLSNEWGDDTERSGNRYQHGPTDEDEGSFPATGWHVEKEHGEYEGVYSPLLDDTDELVAWRAVADYPEMDAAPQQPAAVDELRALVDRTAIDHAPALPSNWGSGRAYVEAWMAYRRLVEAALAANRQEGE